MSNPKCSASASSIWKKCEVFFFSQGTIAPSRTERVPFGTTRSGSKSSVVPRPAQVGQAPWGELNEKSRGSSGGKLMPSSTQANFELKRSSLSGPFWSTSSAFATPSPSLSAISSESAKRRSEPGFTTARSTTTSMVCFLFLSSTISSARSRVTPSIFTRT
jgi:hypothetical protein